VATRTGPAELRILGVMTGTSCDGLDAACLQVSRSGWEVLWEASRPYPRSLKKRVLAVQSPARQDRLFAMRALMELHRDLGDWYGSELATCILKKPAARRPHVVANHGQTIAHYPSRGSLGTTLQLGDPARIARATRLTVVSNFRDGDMAAGGQGAPLVPLFHKMIVHHLSGGEGGIAIHNIGGISNLTYAGREGRILAFDTGPGNMWIDAAAETATGRRQTMDREGRLSGAARPDEFAVRSMLSHGFFKQPPPKSTSRDSFPFEMLLRATRSRGKVLVATAVAITVESIALAYERWITGAKKPLNAIYLCGGGARNPSILKGLRKRLPSTRITTLEQAGLDSQYTEAQAFAFFGFMALMGQPVGGEWTGAHGFGPPAHIIPGENWNVVVKSMSQTF